MLSVCVFAPVIEGPRVSTTVMVCVSITELFPHPSFATNVFVNVPVVGHEPTANTPGVLVIVGEGLQLSVATGINNCAAVSLATSQYSTVVFNEPAGVVHVGTWVSPPVNVTTTGVALPQASVTV